MRFGGNIAAIACFVLAGALAAQTPDQAPAPNQPATEQTQPQVQDPQAEGQPSQQQANDPSQKKPTADEEYQKKIREYDPTAKQPPQSQPQSQSGTQQSGTQQSNEPQSGGQQSSQTPEPDTDKPKAPASATPSRGAEPAGIALPGPSVGVPGTDADSSDLGAYNGPAVLSRSYTLLRPAVPTPSRWRPIVGVNGVYDSGLSGLQINSQGSRVLSSSFGTELMWGINGRQYFHNDVLGVDYRGDMQYYSRAKNYDGSNHWLNLDYTHRFTRRLSMTLVESGSVYSQNYALQNPVAVSDQSIATVNLSTTPNIQVFDNGLKQFSSSVDITYQKSARLSFDAGGSWFAVDRNASYLYGVSGVTGRADALYRITRRMTLGGSYDYTQYWYPHGIGRADFHSIDAIYSWALSSSLQLRTRGGASRLDSSGLTTYSLPTPIADLLGVNSVTVEYRSVTWVSNYSAQLIKDFRRGRSASVSYARGLTPGNGLYLASVDQTATADGSFIVGRRYYTSVGCGYDSLSGAALTLGTYRSFFAFAGLSRSLNHGVQSNLRFDYRHFIISGSPLLQNEFRVTLGFSWSPAEGLARLW